MRAVIPEVAAQGAQAMGMRGSVSTARNSRLPGAPARHQPSHAYSWRIPDVAKPHAMTNQRAQARFL
jgi:hypothetical protein